jgi:hypothetical protein
MWYTTPDGSIVDHNKKVIFFSTQRFVNDICLGGCCFICGASPGSVPFNNEHILPEWILRRYSLFEQTISLPNKNKVRYNRYTVPCCANCNDTMGKEIEKPVSAIITAGPETVNEFLTKGGLLKFAVWMGLIFLKTHLKDRLLRQHLDPRKSTQAIAEQYDWSDLHHLHTLVRCFYSGSEVTQEAVGSFLALPIRREASPDDFDFFDLNVAQTLMIRLNDIALVAVFNDSGGAMNCFEQKLNRVTGPVSELQLREIAVELAFLNLHLDPRPTFHSEIDKTNEVIKIVANRPPVPKLADLDYGVRGALLNMALEHALPSMRFPPFTTEQVQDLVRAGRLSVLFDDDGKFISTGIVPEAASGGTPSGGTASSSPPP